MNYILMEFVYVWRLLEVKANLHIDIKRKRVIYLTPTNVARTTMRHIRKVNFVKSTYLVYQKTRRMRLSFVQMHLENHGESGNRHIGNQYTAPQACYFIS